MADLVLFSRQGCCLCEGLEQRLRDLDLQALGLVLMVVDICLLYTSDAADE